MRTPSAVLFDAYGTLFDVAGVEPLADKLLPGHGARLAALWRTAQIDCTRLLTTTGTPRPARRAGALPDASASLNRRAPFFASL